MLAKLLEAPASLGASNDDGNNAIRETSKIAKRFIMFILLLCFSSRAAILPDIPAAFLSVESSIVGRGRKLRGKSPQQCQSQVSKKPGTDACLRKPDPYPPLLGLFE